MALTERVIHHYSFFTRHFYLPEHKCFQSPLPNVPLLRVADNADNTAACDLHGRLEIVHSKFQIMDNSQNVNDVFLQYGEYMKDEQSVREEIVTQVRELEQAAREMTTLLQSVHQQDGIKNTASICEKAKAFYPAIRAHYASLAAKVPKDQYYRFHDHWRFVTQRMAFVAALLVYLESEQLATQQMVADSIGVALKKEDGFTLDLEDYLAGLLMLSSELARFVVNSVTAGDYLRPFSVAQFLSELSSGFRLLNLKNDSLRKRFDGLKYDLKKVEEVVYDLSIRGLKPKQET